MDESEPDIDWDKYKWRYVVRSIRGYYEITYPPGPGTGEVPEALRGKYTGETEAKKAIIAYLYKKSRRKDGRPKIRFKKLTGRPSGSKNGVRRVGIAKNHYESNKKKWRRQKV